MSSRCGRLISATRGLLSLYSACLPGCRRQEASCDATLRVLRRGEFVEYGDGGFSKCWLPVRLGFDLCVDVSSERASRFVTSSILVVRAVGVIHARGRIGGLTCQSTVHGRAS